MKQAVASTAFAWPANDADPFTSDTQLATPWTEFSEMFPGVKVRPFDPGAPAEFWISFDSRGVPIERKQAATRPMSSGQASWTRSQASSPSRHMRRARRCSRG